MQIKLLVEPSSFFKVGKHSFDYLDIMVNMAQFALSIVNAFSRLTDSSLMSSRFPSATDQHAAVRTKVQSDPICNFSGHAILPPIYIFFFFTLRTNSSFQGLLKIGTANPIPAPKTAIFVQNYFLGRFEKTNSTFTAIDLPNLNYHSKTSSCPTKEAYLWLIWMLTYAITNCIL